MRPVSIVTIVGAGMRGTPGIAGRIFTALGQNNRVNRGGHCPGVFGVQY
jgi:aspartokinase